jgi:hypothetical protein
MTAVDVPQVALAIGMLEPVEISTTDACTS